MDGPFPFTHSRRTGRAFELRLAKFRDPQTRVDVVEIHQTVQQRAVASHRARLSAPGERQIGPESFAVSRPEAGNFAALSIKIAAQFARNIEHARAAGVHKLIGTYRPTERNKLVLDHYAKIGFSKVREEESGLTEWEFLVQSATEWEMPPMKVVSTGFTIVAETPVS